MAKKKAESGRRRDKFRGRKVAITCEGSAMLALEELEHFQGELKTLEKRDALKIRESLLEHGFTFPVFVWKAPDKTKKIIDGHQRVFVLRRMIEDDGAILEGNKVPVVWIHAKDLREAKKKVLLAASNYARIHQDGLHEFIETSDLKLDDIRKTVAFFGVDLSRFEDCYYKEIGNTDPDSAPAIDRTNTKTKLGDVWIMGDHRLLCGSSTNSRELQTLMGGGFADMVFTDPPYNVNYSGRGEKTSNTILNDQMSSDDFRKFLTDAFGTMKEASKNTAPIYICYTSKTHREFEDALNANGFEVKNQIIWVKTVASMGWGDYRWKHEPILYCHRKGIGVQFFGERTEYTVWENEQTDEELLAFIKKMIRKEERGESTVWRLGRDKQYEHPTQKPVQLVEIAIANSSRRDDIVLDLFGGSGTTLIAAHRLGRKAYLCELDPYYCDVIVERWEKFTGEKATRG